MEDLEALNQDWFSEDAVETVLKAASPVQDGGATVEFVALNEGCSMQPLPSAHHAMPQHQQPVQQLQASQGMVQHRQQVLYQQAAHLPQHQTPSQQQPPPPTTGAAAHGAMYQQSGENVHYADASKQQMMMDGSMQMQYAQQPHQVPVQRQLGPPPMQRSQLQQMQAPVENSFNSYAPQQSTASGQQSYQLQSSHQANEWEMQPPQQQQQPRPQGGMRPRPHQSQPMLQQSNQFHPMGQPQYYEQERGPAQLQSQSQPMHPQFNEGGRDAGQRGPSFGNMQQPMRMAQQPPMQQQQQTRMMVVQQGQGQDGRFQQRPQPEYLNGPPSTQYMSSGAPDSQPSYVNAQGNYVQVYQQNSMGGPMRVVQAVGDQGGDGMGRPQSQMGQPMQRPGMPYGQSGQMGGPEPEIIEADASPKKNNRPTKQPPAPRVRKPTKAQQQRMAAANLTPPMQQPQQQQMMVQPPPQLATPPKAAPKQRRPPPGAAPPQKIPTLDDITAQLKQCMSIRFGSTEDSTLFGELASQVQNVMLDGAKGIDVSAQLMNLSVQLDRLIANAEKSETDAFVQPSTSMGAGDVKPKTAPARNRKKPPPKGKIEQPMGAGGPMPMQPQMQQPAMMQPGGLPVSSNSQSIILEYNGQYFAAAPNAAGQFDPNGQMAYGNKVQLQNQIPMQAAIQPEPPQGGMSSPKKPARKRPPKKGANVAATLDANVVKSVAGGMTPGQQILICTPGSSNQPVIVQYATPSENIYTTGPSGAQQFLVQVAAFFRILRDRLDKTDYISAFKSRADAVNRLLPFSLVDEPNYSEEHIAKVDRELFRHSVYMEDKVRHIEGRLRRLYYHEAMGEREHEYELNLLLYLDTEYEKRQLATDKVEAKNDNGIPSFRESEIIRSGVEYQDLKDREAALPPPPAGYETRPPHHFEYHDFDERIYEREIPRTPSPPRSRPHKQKKRENRRYLDSSDWEESEEEDEEEEEEDEQPTDQPMRDDENDEFEAAERVKREAQSEQLNAVSQKLSAIEKAAQGEESVDKIEIHLEEIAAQKELVDSLLRDGDLTPNASAQASATSVSAAKLTKRLKRLQAEIAANLAAQRQPTPPPPPPVAAFNEPKGPPQLNAQPLKSQPPTISGDGLPMDLENVMPSIFRGAPPPLQRTMVAPPELLLGNRPPLGGLSTADMPRLTPISPPINAHRPAAFGDLPARPPPIPQIVTPATNAMNAAVGQAKAELLSQRLAEVAKSTASAAHQKVAPEVMKAMMSSSSSVTMAQAKSDLRKTSAAQQPPPSSLSARLAAGPPEKPPVQPLEPAAPFDDPRSLNPFAAHSNAQLAPPAPPIDRPPSANRPVTLKQRLLNPTPIVSTTADRVLPPAAPAVSSRFPAPVGLQPKSEEVEPKKRRISSTATPAALHVQPASVKTEAEPSTSQPPSAGRLNVPLKLRFKRHNANGAPETRSKRTPTVRPHRPPRRPSRQPRA
ncbi:GLTSCR1 domain-containing protein [Aphelenchoides fujianensis]|nr:GLTSCR1 domain-containing protein [Aphelenchoides fujianensis]